MIKYSENYLKGRIFMSYKLLSKVYYKNKDIFETEFAALRRTVLSWVHAHLSP